MSRCSTRLNYVSRISTLRARKKQKNIERQRREGQDVGERERERRNIVGRKRAGKFTRNNTFTPTTTTTTEEGKERERHTYNPFFRCRARTQPPSSPSSHAVKLSALSTCRFYERSRAYIYIYIYSTAEQRPYVHVSQSRNTIFRFLL